MAGTGLHKDRFVRRKIFPNGHIAFARIGENIAGHRYIFCKLDVPFIFYNHSKIPLRGRILRYGNPAVIRMQRQVTGGIKFSVLGNHDIIRLVFIARIHGDIAFIRPR